MGFKRVGFVLDCNDLIVCLSNENSFVSLSSIYRKIKRVQEEFDLISLVFSFEDLEARIRFDDSLVKFALSCTTLMLLVTFACREVDKPKKPY